MNNDLLEGFVPHPQLQDHHYQQQGLWLNQPLWTILEESAQKMPDHIAVIDEETSISYKNLLLASDQIALGFINDGLKPGDRVVFQWPNDLDFAKIFFAILRAGLVPIMALPAHGFHEIVHFIQTSGAKAYITTDSNGSQERLQTKESIQNKTSLLERFYCCGDTPSHHSLPKGEIKNSQFFSPPAIPPHHPALFLVSGGTTGLPKLIPRTHNDYHYNIKCSANTCQLNQEDTYLVVLPAAHNFPLACPGILGTLSVGGRVVFASQSSPDHCFQLIEKHQVTATALVPALAQVWAMATQWEPTDVSSLKLLQVGGSKLSTTDAKKVLAAFPGALQQVFGMAEGLLCYTHLGDHEEKIIHTQGHPMSLFDEVRIVDPLGKEVPVGTNGELLVRGPYTLRGYYRAESHNKLAFTKDGFYRSGDRVCQQPDGSLIVTGRIKDVINRAGETIATDEIEEMLLTHPSIRKVAIVPIPDKDIGERIGAAIVFNTKSLELLELREYLISKGVTSYKLPERLQIMKTLPLTAVGKIDKKCISFS